MNISESYKFFGPDASDLMTFEKWRQQREEQYEIYTDRFGKDIDIQDIYLDSNRYLPGTPVNRFGTPLALLDQNLHGGPKSIGERIDPH